MCRTNHYNHLININFVISVHQNGETNKLASLKKELPSTMRWINLIRAPERNVTLVSFTPFLPPSLLPSLTNASAPVLYPELCLFERSHAAKYALSGKQTHSMPCPRFFSVSVQLLACQFSQWYICDDARYAISSIHGDNKPPRDRKRNLLYFFLPIHFNVDLRNS